MKRRAYLIIKMIVSIIITMTLVPSAMGAEKKSKVKTASKKTIKTRTQAMETKKKNSLGAIQEAAFRSVTDHGKMKKKVQQEKVERQAAWAERGTGAIEIQGSGAFTGMEYLTQPTTTGGPGAGEVDIYDHGKDLSGLKSLKSQVKLENTDADIDAELEEVGRGIDSDLKAETQQKASKPNNPSK